MPPTNDEDFLRVVDKPEEGVVEEPAPFPPIASYAVLDLETSNLPAYNFNRVGITELSVYGFAAELLEKPTLVGEGAEVVQVPATPRVLHKLTLLLNPRQMIHPDAERVTGLNNFLLEFEKPFDENAANTLLGFLRHLPAPVCLVAHNGWSFDFPIVKQALDKLQMALPAGTVCLDSLQAFQEIDHNRKIAITATTAATAPTTVRYTEPEPEPYTEPDTTTTPTSQLPGEPTAAATVKAQNITTIGEVLNDALIENSLVNWRAINENTPKRPPNSAAAASAKRRLSTESLGSAQETPSPKRAPPTLRSRRSLFAASPSGKPERSLRGRKFREYPPKGVYRLGPMFERVFGQAPKNAHHAEADVEMLMQLMMHYGEDFAAYAAERSLPFDEVRPLGK